jgi:hypothetical protein
MRGNPLFALYAVNLRRMEDRTLTKTIEEKGPVRSREDYSGAKTPASSLKTLPL